MLETLTVKLTLYFYISMNFKIIVKKKIKNFRLFLGYLKCH